MKPGRQQLATRVLHAVRAVLPPSATVRLHRRAGPAVELRVNGHPLRTHWLGEGWPPRVKEALAVAGPQPPHVLVARVMSPGAQAAARRAGVGWIDEAGSAELALDWIVLARSPRAEPPAMPSAEDWTPATTGVAEAILTGTLPTVQETQRATGLSSGLCVRALAFFAQQDYLTSEARRGPKSGRRLTDPDGLLHAYAEATRRFPRTELRVAALWRDPIEGVADLGRAWTKRGLRWAATGTVAAGVLAPYLTDVGTAEVYVEGETAADLTIATEHIRARPIEGGRLVLRLFPSTATAQLSTSREELCIAPWPRVYADLLTTGVRGEDAAEHLLEVVRARG